MTNRLRAMTAFVLALTTALALASCSGDEDGSAGDGPTELSFLMWGDGGETDQAYKDVIKSFNAQNPDITVKAEFFNTNDYDRILKTRLSGGAGPDVYGFDLGNLENFVTDGFATDLTGGKYLDKLTEDAASETTRSSADGGAYNVPVALSGNGIIYNTELFDKAGITEEPTSYTEFVRACEKLLAEDVTPIAMSAQDNWWPQFIVYYALAGHGADEKLADQMLAGKATFSGSDAWRRSLKIVQELKPYYMPNPVGTSQTAAQSAFLSGKAAIFPATWILTDAREAGLDVGYMNFPTTNQDTDAMWGTYQVRFGINPGNDKVEAAQEFLTYFFSDKVYSEFIAKVKLFPVTTTVDVSAETDPLFPDMEQSWEDKQFKTLFSPPDTAMQEALLVVLQNVISGEQSVDEALAELDRSLEDLRASRQ